ncbi:MAG: YciI family protein [Hyphomicrobiales bacterium]
MMVYYSADADRETPPTVEEMAEMGAFIDEYARRGILVMTDGLLPSSRGVRVRQQEGKVTVTDGPFTESKELIAGFAIVKTASKDEAVDLARKFLAIAGDGVTEIREMYDQPAYPPQQ